MSSVIADPAKPNLEYVVPRWYVSDVNPLAVDVGVICVVASRSKTLRKRQTYTTYLCSINFTFI